MIGRTSRKRQFQQADPECLRRGRPATVAAMVVAVAVAASATPVFARHPRMASTDPAAAAAVVERLRELPLPMRAFPNGIASMKEAPAPLPALESRRQEVYDDLHALGPAGVQALARALRDPDPEMRRAAAVALDVVGGGWWQFPDGRAKLDLRPALPALLAALGDSDSGVRAWAAQDISDMGAAAAATAIPHLRAMLRNPDPGSRGSACNALGQMGSAAHAALPDLNRTLGDPSPEVRQAARAALVSIERADALH